MTEKFVPHGYSTAEMGLTSESSAYKIEVVPVKMNTLRTVRSLIDGVIAKQEQIEIMRELIGINPEENDNQRSFRQRAFRVLHMGSAVELDNEELRAVLTIRIRTFEATLDEMIENLQHYNVRIARDGNLDLKTVAA